MFVDIAEKHSRITIVKIRNIALESVLVPVINMETIKMETKKLEATDVRDAWDSHIAIEDDSDAWRAQRKLENQVESNFERITELQNSNSQIVSSLEEIVFLLEDIRRILQEETSHHE